MLITLFLNNNFFQKIKKNDTFQSTVHQALNTRFDESTTKLAGKSLIIGRVGESGSGSGT